MQLTTPEALSERLYIPTDEEWFMIPAVLGDSSIAEADENRLRLGQQINFLGHYQQQQRLERERLFRFAQVRIVGILGGNFGSVGCLVSFGVPRNSTTTISGVALARCLDYMDEHLLPPHDFSAGRAFQFVASGMPSESRSEKSSKKDYLLIMARLIPTSSPKPQKHP